MTLAKVLDKSCMFEELKKEFKGKLADVGKLFNLSKDEYEKVKTKTPLLTGSYINHGRETAIYIGFDGVEIGTYNPVFQGASFKFLPGLKGARLTEVVKNHESIQYLRTLLGFEHNSPESMLEKISKLENPEKVIITDIPERKYGTMGIIFIQYLENKLVIDNTDKPHTIFGYPLVLEETK